MAKHVTAQLNATVKKILRSYDPEVIADEIRVLQTL